MRYFHLSTLAIQVGVVFVVPEAAKVQIPVVGGHAMALVVLLKIFPHSLHIFGWARFQDPMGRYPQHSARQVLLCAQVHDMKLIWSYVAQTRIPARR